MKNKHIPLTALIAIFLFGGFFIIKFLYSEEAELSTQPNTSEQNLSNFPPCNVEEIPHYTAYKIDSTPTIDGKLDESIW